tara:strand:- start:31323 stop:32504 length:1182 start_codon:yes stop_codon:yes gene_type:complete
MAWTTPRTWVSGELVTAALMNSAIRDNLNILKVPINDSGQLEFTDATQLTIASGAITVTQNYHKVDTESDAGTDDLATITAGTDVAAGFVLHLRVESDARTVVIKNGTGGAANLDIGADVTLDESYKTYSLVYDGTNWRPLMTFSESQTFAGLSPLTTRGDTLVSTSGTVTGTRLAVGGANTYLKSDGTDVAWAALSTTFAGLSPLTTRGDLLYSSSGTVTGTRLAVGGANEVLTSDGTDVAWAAAAGGGKLVQVQSMYYTAQVGSTTSTFATTNVLDTITLADSNNKCLVIVTISGVQKVNATSCQLRIRRAISGGATTTIPGSGNFESQAGWTASAVTQDVGTCAFCVFDDPTTASAITYTVEFNNGQDVGNTYVMSGNGRGSITLIEIEV